MSLTRGGCYIYWDFQYLKVFTLDIQSYSGYNKDMKASVSAKRCPECSKVTSLQATECLNCGHLFRTRFAEPSNRTEAFDAMMLPRAPAVMPHPRSQNYPIRRPRKLNTPSTFSLAFAASFCLIAVVGMVIWLALSLGRNTEVSLSHSPSATLTGAIQTGSAEEFYERIGISMSLYDLDQAAGSMGRIIHTNNPHALLLSYDFPDQSVRVSLYRNDITSDDYRVDAVALYHGNTLMHRHTDN